MLLLDKLDKYIKNCWEY